MSLSNDDAIALWRRLGVSDSRQELVALFRSFERHPFLACLMHWGSWRRSISL